MFDRHRRLGRLLSLAPGLGACCLLLGCTTWVRPGADDAMRQVAETHCEAVAHTTLPANIVTSRSVGSASYADLGKCQKNSTSGKCEKINGRYSPIGQVTTDVNTEGRDAVFRDCMYSNGWREQ